MVLYLKYRDFSEATNIDISDEKQKWSQFINDIKEDISKNIQDDPVHFIPVVEIV